MRPYRPNGPGSIPVRTPNRTGRFAWKAELLRAPHSLITSLSVSSPTLLGLLVGITVVFIAFFTGAPEILSWALALALIGWLFFALRDIRRS